MSSKSDATRRRSCAYRRILIGVLLLLAGLIIFLLTMYPVLQEEFAYQRHKTQERVIVLSAEEAEQYGPEYQVLTIPNKEFSIIVPKIAAVAPVVSNVNPFDANVYQRKLTQGVAHAEGTSLPGRIGNTFIFAHSAGNFYEANRYNAVFYLLNKLEKGDPIHIFYKNNEYVYGITDILIVEPDTVEFLTSESDVDALTLMTCWPAGTTLKRLIVKAERQ